MERKLAKRWLVAGRVQGVGFRYFVQQQAAALALNGWTRNLDDGRVEVYALGTQDRLNQLAAALHKGPRMAEVRSVEETEAAVESHSHFAVR